jgi:hypothetical protein
VLWPICVGISQPYLCGLGMLPYADRANVALVLQDVGEVTPSTESSHCDAAIVGLNKTTLLKKGCWPLRNCGAVGRRYLGLALGSCGFI